MGGGGNAVRTGGGDMGSRNAMQDSNEICWRGLWMGSEVKNSGLSSKIREK